MTAAMMNRYGCIPVPLIAPLAKLGAATFAVYTALAAHCGGEKRHCWPSQAQLARMTGLSPDSGNVRRALRRLERAGFITTTKGGSGRGDVNEYTITLPAQWLSLVKGDPSATEKGAPRAPLSAADDKGVAPNPLAADKGVPDVPKRGSHRTPGRKKEEKRTRARESAPGRPPSGGGATGAHQGVRRTPAEVHATEQRARKEAAAMSDRERRAVLATGIASIRAKLAGLVPAPRHTPIRIAAGSPPLHPVARSGTIPIPEPELMEVG